MRTRARRSLLLNTALGLLVAWSAWVGAHAGWGGFDDRAGPVDRGPGPGMNGPWLHEAGPAAPGVSWVVAPFLVLVAVGIALRWRYPRAAFVAVVTGLGGCFAAGGYFGPALVAPALVVYPMAATLPLRRWVPLTALLVPMIMAAHVREPYLGLLGPWLYAGLFTGVAVAVLPATVALLRQSRREADRRGREDERRRSAYEERLRIGREVHDVVGHSLSVVTMQAGVALHLLDKQRAAGHPVGAEVTASLEAIRRTSREALAELRTTLEVFREPAADAPRAPRAGLDRLDDLVGALRQAGRRIELVRDPGVAPLPAAVDQAAFRIIQEGLTNVVRHAGDVGASVRVTQEPDRLVLEVADEGVLAPTVAEGNGIRGMRERARAVGGRVSLMPRPAGGLLLRADLPLAPLAPLDQEAPTGPGPSTSSGPSTGSGSGA